MPTTLSYTLMVKSLYVMKINLRPAALLALSLAGGIFAGFLNLINQGLLPLLTAGAVTAAVLSGTLIFARRFSKFKRLNAAAPWVLVCCAAACLGFMLFYINVTSITSVAETEGEYSVTGTVKDVYSTSSGNYYFIISGVSLQRDTRDIAAEGNVFVYINQPQGQGAPSAGDVVNFNSALYKSDVLNEGYINTYAVRSGINYNCYISEPDITVVGASRSPVIAVKKWLRGQLLQNMGSKNADVAYALLLGDSLHMDSGVKQMFSESGIAHIFSVSGLHVGVLSAVIIFALKKLRAGGKTVFVCVSAVLLLYAALCGFAPGVTRALIMVVIYLGAAIAGRKYDGLSALSAAAFLILVINPLTLFDAGFLLSVSAVCAIFLLQRPLNRLLMPLPKALRSAAAVTLSAQIGVVPVLAAFYGQLPILGLLLNLLVVPAVSFAYIWLLAVLPLVGVLPFLSFLYRVPDGILYGATAVVAALSLTGLFTLKVKTAPAVAVVLFYALIFALSAVVRFGRLRLKAAVSLALCVAVAAAALLPYRPLDYKEVSFAALYSDSADLSVITLDGGGVAVVCYGGAEDNADSLKQFLYQNAIYTVDLVVCFTGDTFVVAVAKLLAEEYALKEAVFPYAGQHSLMAREVPMTRFVLSGERYIYKNTQFAAYYYNDEFYGGAVTASGVTALYLAQQDNKALGYLQNNMFFDVGLLFTRSFSAEAAQLYRPYAVITGNSYYGVYSEVHSTMRSGSLIFEIKGDNIIRKYAYRWI